MSAKKVPIAHAEPSSVCVNAQCMNQEVLFSENERTETYVMASLESVLIEGDETRQALELFIVLDKSGSMAGENKMGLCKTTMEFLIEEMTSKDSLSIIAFDSDVDIIQPLTTMNADAKAAALLRVNQLQPGSNTNLSGGLLQACQDMAQSYKKDSKTPRTRSILCLTDGQVNAGVVDSKQLLTLVKNTLKELKDEAVTIHAFGYGTDADNLYLKTLSDGFGGQFFPIPNADDVATAFGNCIGGLLAISCQNISINFEYPHNEIQILDVLTKFVVDKTQTGRVRVQIPDIYSEERRDVLFKISLPPRTTSDYIGKFTFTFMDIPYGKFTSLERDLTILRPKVLSADAEIPLAEVVENVGRVEGARAMEESRVLADSGNIKKASERLDQVCDRLEVLGLRSAPIFADITKAKEITKNYNSAGQSGMMGMYEAHYQQRSNLCASGFMDSDDSEDAVGKFSSYMTTASRNMAKKAKAFSNAKTTFISKSPTTTPNNNVPSIALTPTVSKAAPAPAVAAAPTFAQRLSQRLFSTSSSS